jgi:hypothetical protein
MKILILLLVTITSSEFFALSIDRARYKEKLFLGSLTLKLTQALQIN